MKNIINNIPLVNSFYIIWSSPLEVKHTVKLKKRKYSSKFDYTHKLSNNPNATTYFTEKSKAKTSKLLTIS